MEKNKERKKFHLHKRILEGRRKYVVGEIRRLKLCRLLLNIFNSWSIRRNKLVQTDRRTFCYFIKYIKIKIR